MTAQPRLYIPDLVLEVLGLSPHDRGSTILSTNRLATLGGNHFDEEHHAVLKTGEVVKISRTVEDLPGWFVAEVS